LILNWERIIYKHFPPHQYPNQIPSIIIFFSLSFIFSSLSLSRFFSLSKHIDLSSFSLPFPSIAGRWMSGTRTPPAAAPDQIMQRQLPFSSMKPPFLAAGDYHRFAPDHRRNQDLETEAIVVKTPVSFLFFYIIIILFFYVFCEFFLWFLV